MSKLSVTNFKNRTGSPFKKEANKTEIIHDEVFERNFEKQKEKQGELIQKVTKKAAEYQAHKPSNGMFTEVVTHGAFTVKTPGKTLESKQERQPSPPKINGVNAKSLMGFPSSANDLALDAKSDLESDNNISKEVKDKVIKKLFTLVSMVQHVYESKVRVMTDFEKFKDVQLKNEARREKEHSEQLYKLNMNFQSEVVQAIQRLKSELDITRNVEKRTRVTEIDRSAPVDFNTEGRPDLDKNGDENMKRTEDENKTDSSVISSNQE